MRLGARSVRNQHLRPADVFVFAGQVTSLSLEGSRRGLGWRGGKDKGKDKSKAGRSGLARGESRASSKHQAASRGQARIVSLPPLCVFSSRQPEAQCRANGSARMYRSDDTRSRLVPYFLRVLGPGCRCIARPSCRVGTACGHTSNTRSQQFQECSEKL